MLSPLDDFPVHQIPEVIRHVGTSDRNFYDRYYFNCYSPEHDLWLITGLGQYPNLGVQDAFAMVRHGDDHVVVRSSRELGADRMDLTVGPYWIEVVEGLRTLRVVLEPSEHDLSFDLTFTGGIPAHVEPRHTRREMERVTFDTMRFVQTGHWSGSLTLDGETRDVRDWRGNRDRSWGIRPVGEPEPAGRKEHSNFFWIYSVMEFGDFSVIVIVQEDQQGRRIMEEATKVYPDGRTEWLGRPEHELRFAPDSRDIVGGTLTFHRPNQTVQTIECEPLLEGFIGVGTGYGQLEPDWRHGLWHGETPAVQGLRRKVSEFDLMTRMFCPVDNLARFTFDGQVGTGLFEVAAIGPHDQYGFTSFLDVWSAQ